MLVVDNDPQATASPYVTGLADPLVRYVHEPTPGIAAARNRALREAGSADAVVFIDDDEIPGEGWLEALLASWRHWDCAGVSGPVISVFETPPDDWIVGSRLFDRRVYRDGDQLRGAATNNLLLDLDVVRELGLSFDERFGLTGGEDTMFTRALVQRGGVLRWCEAAQVLDPIPVDRLTRGWVLRRYFRAGTSWSMVELTLAGRGRRRALRRVDLLARAAFQLARSAVGVAGGAIRRDVRRRAQGLAGLAGASGMLAGATGYSYREYHRGD